MVANISATPGMAKAALEAINGINVFGRGMHGSGGFIYVDPDALNRNRYGVVVFWALVRDLDGSRRVAQLRVLR